jgi:hypothetical protein
VGAWAKPFAPLLLTVAQSWKVSCHLPVTGHSRFADDAGFYCLGVRPQAFPAEGSYCLGPSAGCGLPTNCTGQPLPSSYRGWECGRSVDEGLGFGNEFGIPLPAASCKRCDQGSGRRLGRGPMGQTWPGASAFRSSASTSSNRLSPKLVPTFRRPWLAPLRA